MNWIYEQLANPYFAAFVAGLATFGIMYIDGKITKKEVTKKSYTKNILFVALLCGTIVYILANTTLNPKIGKIVGGGANNANAGANASTPLGEGGRGRGGEGGGTHVRYDTSDIFIGEPKF